MRFLTNLLTLRFTCQLMYWTKFVLSGLQPQVELTWGVPESEISVFHLVRYISFSPYYSLGFGSFCFKPLAAVVNTLNSCSKKA